MARETSHVGISIHSIQHSSYRIILRHKADPLPQLSTDLRVNPSTNAKLLKTIKPNKLYQEISRVHQEGDRCLILRPSQLHEKSATRREKQQVKTQPD
jgi:hypothetical protein